MEYLMAAFLFAAGGAVGWYLSANEPSLLIDLEDAKTYLLNLEATLEADLANAEASASSSLQTVLAAVKAELAKL